MKSVIALQDEYIARVNAGIARWAHRKDGGHAGRIMRGARRKLEAELKRAGFNDGQIAQAVKDARDVAELERIAL